MVNLKSPRRVAFLLVLMVLFALAALTLVGQTKRASPKIPKQSASTSPATSRAAQADSLNNLGVGYMNQQQFEKALGYFRRAYALQPRLTIARLNQAIALLNLQRMEQATAILLDIVKHDPQNVRAWYNLGLLYKSEGQAEPAADAFEHVTKLDRTDADSFYFLGSVRMQLKQYPQAIAAFQQALKLNTYHASAEFGLARAYQQSGDLAHAREHLARFQQITKIKLGTPMSVAYGEQGPLSLAATSSATPEPVPPAIPVRLVDVSAHAGLGSSSAGQEKPSLDRASTFLPPGACVFDFDGDGHPDLFIADGGPQGGMALYRNLGDGRFADVTKAAGLDPNAHAIACAAGDYDNDGFTDLAIGFNGRVALYHNEKDGKFRDVTQSSEVRVNGLPLGMTFIDYDHDGDLDLYITRGVDVANKSGKKRGQEGEQSNILLRNNGNQTFTDVTGETGLQGPGFSLGAVSTDLNNDRAIDLVVTSPEKPPTIFLNPREGKFSTLGSWSGAMPPPAAGVAVLDYNKDGWMDLAFTHWSAPGLSLWRNAEGKSFEPVQLPKLNWARGWGLAALDFDNDGWIDLAAVGETDDGRGEVRLFRNLGPNGFKDVTAEVGLDKIQLHDPRALVTWDYDGDGATDLLITQNHGPVVLLRNQGGSRNNWLRIALKGLNDNKSAIGAKVEVFAGAVHQKWEVQGSSGYLGQNSPEITAGLNGQSTVDVLRLLWPTGVVQDEIQLAARKQANILEIDRRGSSCPTLFAWDGKHFDFISDMLGAGVVGHWVGPGERNIPRPTEYVKIDGDHIRLRDGKLSFRFMEPMEEVVYLDHTRLLAVDHPADTEVYPNEYFASNPPYPEFKVISSRNARPPVAARDDAGSDVLAQLLYRDRKYVTGFELLPFAGFTKMHTLELDLGEPYASGPLRLLLHGYVDYFTATSMYAANQAGVHAVAPYIEALRSNGKWTRVVDDMGFPAGLPRTITTDLSKKLPAGTRRICIRTNLQIYWDQVLIDRTDDTQLSVRLTPVPLADAQLRFHGYPRQVARSLPGDINFLYDQVSATGPYAREQGNYTRYGDVVPLVSKSDDRFVVFGSGEEVALDFDPRSLPPLSPGWKRDYFFMADGYEKDMDFYAAEANTVAPLPFHDMGVYPYSAGKGLPLDDMRLRDLLEYNTRYISGSEPRSYRFQF